VPLKPEDFSNVPGQTPLSQEDLDGLIPDHILTREELNAWEAENIRTARRELESRRAFDVLSTTALSELHRMMFGLTWKWAGTYTKTFSQFTDPRIPITVQMVELVRDTQEQLKGWDGSPDQIDDIALRFHHRLVRIHPWRDGNGRHARAATDELLRFYGMPVFSWGSGADLQSVGLGRDTYIQAMKQADAGDYAALAAFVRS
jgi:Fic-DOC domain mobile mystery protein B